MLTVSNRFHLLQSDSNIETREMQIRQQYKYDIRRTIFRTNISHLVKQPSPTHICLAPNKNNVLGFWKGLKYFIENKRKGMKK